MWIYLARRLLIMIPTLLGVTIVSFLIMQMAPGDPLMGQSGAGGGTNNPQAREAYLIQKRHLRLDKPILLNFQHFRSFAEPMGIVADLMGLDDAAGRALLAEMAAHPKEPEHARRLAFLRNLRYKGRGIRDFDRDLARPEQHAGLWQATRSYLQLFAEDHGPYCVPEAIRLLDDPATSNERRIGAIRALNMMVTSPFVYGYSREPTDEETAAVVGTWRLWWSQAQAKFEPVPEERRAFLGEQFTRLVTAPSRSALSELLDEQAFEREDAPYFLQRLLADDATLHERSIAALVLQLYLGKPLKSDVPLGAKPALVDEVARNWQTYYAAARSEYEPGTLRRLWYIVADTQYAHMVWRLATFNFGRSALKTREPVIEKIWRAVLVSAPLMFWSEVFIFAVAVPLGILCGVYRGSWFDRIASLQLFMLYSIPSFVAGMLLLLFFCYGQFFKWFPTSRLHSEGADDLSLAAYLLDYAWHAFLPVVCLSLSSLAVVAMYSRSSILDVIRQDYIRTARAKGVPEWRVITKHALRNGLIPILTLFSNFLPAMLGGSVLVEYLFSIPGMGYLSWASVDQKDYPTMMAIIYIDALLVMFSILLTDLLYVAVDPRISFSGQGDAA